jgi:hypothetical protein
MSFKRPWPMLGGIVIGVILTVVVAFVLSLLSYFSKSDELDSNSVEGGEAIDLYMERYDWFEDGCPQPPVAAKYMQLIDGDTNYTYTGTLTASNFLGDVNHVFHGLFAIKRRGQTRTIVITTSGDILAVEDSGQVRLLESMDYAGRLYKPQSK